MIPKRNLTSMAFVLAATCALFALFDLVLVERFTVSAKGLLVAALVFLLGGVFRGRRDGARAGRSELRFRGLVLLQVLLVATVLVELALLADRFPWERDLTERAFFTPAPATLHWLGRIVRPVKVTVFARNGSAVAVLAEALLGQLRRRNPLLDFDVVDPDLAPALAARHGIRQPWWAVVESEERSFTFSATTESDYANALRRVARDEDLRVVFVTGHGERDPEAEGRLGMREAAGALRREGLRVDRMDLVETPMIPPEADLVIVAASRSDWSTAELDVLIDYLDLGAGRLLVLFEHDRPPRWEAFLRERFGVEAARAFVVDPASHGTDDATALLVGRWKEHELTGGLGRVLMPGARPLVPSPDDLDRSSTVLALSSDASWGETSLARPGFDAETDRAGPQVLVTLVERRGARRLFDDGRRGRHRCRLLAVGDADFASNALLGALDNRSFWLRLCMTLARDDGRIVLLPRAMEDDRIYLGRRQVRAVFFVTVLGMPFLGFVLAFHAWWVRR